ncbi:non-homologous end joining protein Ku [Cupriavidus pauculus]|uniref:Non-homologous end joining protein Ku n=1 Tax=Cupriavidus pauculus TaxID=82633 RepID=A0A2N5C304_9BURK|nr:Ku protein [Cupriavidus pauculus]PLP96609.1 Ku protein [Cupriavidus pauculus]
MSRAIWKGAISFGLVNIPITVKPASRAHSLDLDLLDKRDMSPVGYQRINKHTGKPVDRDDIVKGYAYEKDEYVVLTDEDFKQANVEATQTVDIVSFVDAAAIPPYYFDTPYYLEPDKRGERGYALLHETMRKTGRAALALVVLRNRQHLAALLVAGKALVLNTMRFADEVVPVADLSLPGGKKYAASAREIQMAAKLVEDMSEVFRPEQYHDTYREDLLARIHARVKAGKTHLLTPAADETAAPARKGAKVIDMMALLKQSLGQRGKRQEGAEAEVAEEADAEEAAVTPKQKPARRGTATAAKRPAAKKATAKSKTASTSSTSSPGRKPAAGTTEKKAMARKRAAKKVAKAAKSSTRSAARKAA